MKVIFTTILSILCWINAGAFKVYIFADMEGCSLLTNREQLNGSEGRLRMAQDINALFAHSFSSATIQMMYLNGRPVGEIGVDASIAGEHRVPVVMVSGDDKTMKEAKDWIPGVVTCQVKKGTSHLSGKCLAHKQSLDLITKKTVQALKKRNSIKPLKATYPATIRWEYLPNGHPRVYDPKFTPVANPRSEEKSSANSIEKLLVGG